MKYVWTIKDSHRVFYNVHANRIEEIDGGALWNVNIRSENSDDWSFHMITQDNIILTLTDVLTEWAMQIVGIAMQHSVVKEEHS